MKKLRESLSLILTVTMVVGLLVGFGKNTYAATPPSAPSSFYYTDLYYNSIKVYWTAATGVTEYALFLEGEEVARVNGTSYIFVNLEPSTTYTMSIKSIKDGIESVEKTTTATTKPKLVSDVIQIIPVGQTEVIVDWNESLGNVKIYRDDKLVNTGYSSPYADNHRTGVKPNTTYTYKVDLIRSDGSVIESTTKEVTTLPSLPNANVTFKLGKNIVNAGDTYIKLAGMDWRVIGDNKLFLPNYVKDSSSSAVYTHWGAEYTATDESRKYNNSKVQLAVGNAMQGLTDAEREGLAVVNIPRSNLGVVHENGEIIKDAILPPSVEELVTYYKLYGPHPTDLRSYFYTRDMGQKRIKVALMSNHNDGGGISITRTYGGTSDNKHYVGGLVAFLAPNVELSGAGTAFNPYKIKGIDPTMPEPVEQPKNFTGVSTGPSTIALTWDAVAGSDGYVLKRDGQLLNSTGTSFSDSGLTPNTEYTYSLQTKVGSSLSDPVTIKIKTQEAPPLDAPSNFRSTQPGTDFIKLEWDGVANAAGYTVKYAGKEVYNGDQTVAVVAGLLPDTEYVFELTAKDAHGTVSDPVTTTARTKQETVDIPTEFTVTKVTYNSVSLMWNPVPGVDSYTVIRDGQDLSTITDTFYTDNTVAESTDYIFGVRANKGSLTSQPVSKFVSTPAKPIEGKAPETPVGLKVTRAYHDKVKLQIPTVGEATYYELYRDGNILIYKGPLTAFVDETTGPEETYTYMVVAGNDYGRTAGSPITVTTPAEAPQIIITPSEPAEGTITFKFNVIEGAYEYHVERNPHWMYTSNGDGSFHLTYRNTVTGETRDYGNVTPEDGKLPFYEENVNPGQDYHYEITAVRMAADGTPEVIGGGEVDVTAPSDGSGATVPNPDGGSTDPGNGDGGSTDPGNGDGGSTNPGGSDGGSTNPGNGDGGSTNPGTGGSTNPGTGGSTNPGSGTGGGGGSTNPGTGGSTNPGTGGGSTNPGTGDNGKETPKTEDGEKTKPEEGTGPSEELPKFSDVKEDHYAYEAINELVSKGILKGYVDGTFKPNKSVTRVEFAVLLTRAFGLEESSDLDGKFSDIKTDAWYSEDLAKALHNEVTKGFTDNTYRPNQLIPREQAAIMVSNVLRMKGLKPSTSDIPFKDKADIVYWAESDVAFAAEYGIIKGHSNGFFKPKAEMTRGEVAVIIQRLLEL